jgi:hypothetical protein
MGRYSEEHRFAFYRDENVRSMQYTRTKTRSTVWNQQARFCFHISTLQIYARCIQWCAYFFPKTVRLLQNNERGFPLIFTITVVELLFYVLFKNISLICRRHHCRWRAAKFRPMLGAQGLWARRDLYRATPVVTHGLNFSGLIRRTAPFIRLLQLARRCGGPILTRILTGLFHVWYS